MQETKAIRTVDYRQTAVTGAWQPPKRMLTWPKRSLRGRSRSCLPATISRWSGPPRPSAPSACARPPPNSSANCNRPSAAVYRGGAAGNVRWRRPRGGTAHGAHRQRRTDTAPGHGQGPTSACDAWELAADSAAARRIGAPGSSLATRAVADRGRDLVYPAWREFFGEAAPLRCARGWPGGAHRAPPAQDFLVRPG
jgi:hypothetical protein